MSDPGHWSALFGETLVKVVSAAGWRVAFCDRGTGKSSSRTSTDLSHADQVCLEKAMRGSRRQIGPGNSTYDWQYAAPGGACVSKGI